MGDLEIRLKRLRIEIKSMVMAFAEPSSSFKISKEYKDMFDVPINFKQFGYSSLESLLKDCSDLEYINAGGQVLFKTKITEGTQSLQMMIASQRKKKKRRSAKPVFQRATRGYRSFAAPTQIRTQLSMNRLSCRGSTAFQRFNTRAPVRVLGSTNPPDGALGTTRFMKILERFDGKVTLRKFREAYETTYGNPLDKSEMESLFGLSNLVAVHSKFLENKMDILELPSGYMLISKDNFAKQKIWEATHTFEIVPNTIKWDKPSLATLYKNVVHLLKEMYPETILIDEASEIYKRFYSVHVDPLALYAKSWQQLTNGVFKEQLQLNQNSISLRQEVVIAENLKASLVTSSQQSTCTSVSDIMIASSDDEYYSDYQNADSDVESVASFFTPSVKTDKFVDDIESNDEKENVAGFGFGRVSSLRKSRQMKKKVNEPVKSALISKPDKPFVSEVAGLQISGNTDEEQKKGRGFGFKSFAKSLISKISDKENVKKIPEPAPPVERQLSVQSEGSASDGSSYRNWNGFQVKCVGEKYMNKNIMERALSHTHNNPLNTSAH